MISRIRFVLTIFFFHDCAKCKQKNDHLNAIQNLKRNRKRRSKKLGKRTSRRKTKKKHVRSKKLERSSEENSIGVTEFGARW